MFAGFLVIYEHLIYKRFNMAKLKLNDITHIAALSNLKLTDSEVKKFLPQLAKIIEYVETLNQVDTSNIEPTGQTTGLTNVLRKDEINLGNLLPQDEVLSATDNIFNGLFKVKAILEGRTDK